MITKFPDYVYIDGSTIRETRLSNVISSQFETGPDQIRPVSSSTKYRLQFTARIHEDNYKEFLNWFELVLKQGAGYFILNDPLSCEIICLKYRFLNKDLVFERSGQIFESSFEIERYGDARL